MQLRLNHAHPLCQPSRNLLFASFGTGYGGQVLDLADRPSHGTMVHGAATPQIIRSLTSDVPPGFPTDYQSLAFRSTNVAYTEFSNPSKVTSATTTLTAAVWVRPYDLTTSHSVPLSLGIGGVSGWSILTSSWIGYGNWTDYVWGLSITSTSSSDNIRISNQLLPLSRWSLIAFTFGPSNPRVTLYTNGVPTGTAYTSFDGDMSSGAYLRIGSYVAASVVPRSDIGPTMIWGSVLTADEIALLYRDTWGMVSTVRISLPTMVAAGATTTTTTTLAVNRPTLGGRGFGSPYIGGYRPGFMRKD